MIENWLNSLRLFIEAVRDVLVAPGEFMLSWFVEIAPLTAANAGLTADFGTTMPAAILSAVFWLLLSTAAWRVFRLLKDVLRNFDAAVRTIWYRLHQAVGSLKTRIVCKVRDALPQRRHTGIDATFEIDFDDLDLAVLRSVAARGPGFALSAPELAEKFRLRPSQVQRSLDKLRRNRMLDSVMGSTDGYDNYRLTRPGATFVAMWQRQNKAS